MDAQFVGGLIAEVMSSTEAAFQITFGALARTTDASSFAATLQAQISAARVAGIPGAALRFATAALQAVRAEAAHQSLDAQPKGH